MMFYEYIVIRPKPGAPIERDERHVLSMDDKRARAIAWLGAKWCLYNKRPPQPIYGIASHKMETFELAGHDHGAFNHVPPRPIRRDDV